MGEQITEAEHRERVRYVLASYFMTNTIFSVQSLMLESSHTHDYPQV
jgi:hypothetical protein